MSQDAALYKAEKSSQFTSNNNNKFWRPRSYNYKELNLAKKLNE